MRSGIYAIVNNANGMLYVGLASRIEERLKQHAREMVRGTSPLSEDLKEYGPDAFDFVVLEYCSGPATLRSREAHWIKSFKPEKLYNKDRYAYREAWRT